MVLRNPVCEYIWKGRSVYFGNGSWSRGVTNVIRSIFAPSYRFNKLKRERSTGGRCMKYAKRHGRAIDNALYRWVYNPLRYRSSLKESNTLVALFKTHGWVAVSSQLVVAWRSARIATKIDLVLYDVCTNKLLVIEIKSGCSYRRVSHGVLSRIRPCVSNAPIHQHQLQVLIGKELLIRTYPKWTTENVEAILIYVASDGEIELIRESEFAVSYTSDISAVLLSTSDKI